MKSIIYVFGALLLGSMFAAEALACKCAARSDDPASIDNAIAATGYVFSGEVVAVSESTSRVRMIVTTFRVIDAWKGLDGKQSTVQVEELTTCHKGFKKGERYLVYAQATSQSASASKPLRVNSSLCTRSRPLTMAKEDLERLGPGLKVEPPMPSRPD